VNSAKAWQLITHEPPLPARRLRRPMLSASAVPALRPRRVQAEVARGRGALRGSALSISASFRPPQPTSRIILLPRSQTPGLRSWEVQEIGGQTIEIFVMSWT
jgi:hypothetical protein